MTSSMMHRNCRLGCCLAGSREVEQREVRKEIEMELTDEQTEERYQSDYEDADFHNREYWYGIDVFSTETGQRAVQYSWVTEDW